jgi:TolB-like protein/DNA-binding winged helix-turn-helix (wHTH) protein/Flp pilus assembly protein TadD
VSNPVSEASRLVRFGVFELDLRSGELRKAGARVNLPDQPLQFLTALLEHPGQLVTRDELRQKLWPSDTFVDFEHGLNAVVKRLRDVLGDSADAPRFIETVPRRGYRFVAPVEGVGRPADDGGPSQLDSSGVARDAVATGQSTRLGVRDQARPHLWKLGTWAIGFAIVMLAGVMGWNRLGVGTPVLPVTIAVLPFEHLGGDPEREYLTDGLTEETSASLGQIDPEHLTVIGRTSTKAYKGTRKSLVEIGRELGVDYLVEGSVRAEGRRLRVTSKLIRVRDQVQMWAQSYDNEAGSLLELQREMSTTIARQIQQRLAPERVTVLAHRHSRNAEAYDLYLRGRYLWNQLTPLTNRRAVEYYLRATELDPEYALAWSGLADAYSASPINSDRSPLEVSGPARNAAARALASGPDLAETQTAVGTVSFWLDWDWPAAETRYRKAISLDPSYSQAHRLLGIVLANEGKQDEARMAMRRARELDPLYPMQLALSAGIAFLARDYSSGLRFAREATAVGPTFWIAYFQLAEIHERLGNSELVLEALKNAEAFSGGNSKMTSLRGYILAKSGRTKEAEEVLTTLNSIAQERYVPPYAMALVHAGLGERDLAFQWLERAYAVRDVHLTWLVRDAKWDPFRGDPRFVDLLSRCDFMRTARRERRP